MTISDALNIVESLQTQGYGQCLLPSVRYNRLFGFTRNDSTLFFSSSAVFVLMKHRLLLSVEQQYKADRICERIIGRYHQFKNPNRLSWNFWSRQPRQWFPGGRLLHHFKYFDLPDDVDSSAMVLLTNGCTREDVMRFHDLLRRHANTVRLSMHNGLPMFREMPFYSTWLGEKMPIELDVCVLSNLMCLFLLHQVPVSEHDLATRDVLSHVILSGQHLTSPFSIAPEYPRTSIILYHLARLAGGFPSFFDGNTMDKLLNDIQLCCKSAQGMDRLLYESALGLLGKAHLVHEPLVMDVVDLKKDDENYWFTAGFLSVFGNAVIQKMAPLGCFHYRYYSNAFRLVLWIEHQLLLSKPS